MEDILDDLTEKAPNTKKLFSVLSFLNGIALWGALFSIGSQIPEQVSPLGRVHMTNLTLVYLTWGLFFSGLFFSIMSFVKKERNSFWKIGGIVLNGLIVILMIGVLAFIFNTGAF